MLIKYKDNPEVSMVSGCNFTPMNLPSNEDYLFGIYGHTWGWGTWKRAWEKFDLNINDFKEKLYPVFLDKISNNRSEKNYYRRLFSKMKAAGPGVNTWDYCWYYYRLTNGLISIIPRVNLTSNIGVYGLHANGVTEHHYRKFDENFKVKTHPISIQRSIDYDTYHFNNYINIKPPLCIRIFRKIMNKIKSFLAKHQSK